MSKRSRAKHRRGVSEVIASLMLLFIVSVLGTFLYSYTLSSALSKHNAIQDEARRHSEMAQERFRVIASWWSGTGDQIRVTVLNYGLNSLQISDAYMNGQRVETWSSGRFTDVYVGNLQNCVFTSPVTITAENTYTLTIVSSRGVSIAHVWKP